MTSSSIPSPPEAPADAASPPAKKAEDEQAMGLKTKADFLFLEELGEGSYSTVYLGSDRNTHTRFAIKVCSKAQIMREKKIQQIFREKECLQKLSRPESYHPFIVRLYCTFQDNESLYFVLSLASRQDLLGVLKKKKKLTVEEARFTTSEIVAALTHIHAHGIIHRDVKPENLLISQSGHIVLSDFGCAKMLEPTTPEPAPPTPAPSSEAPDGPPRTGRRCSFVGTAHYVSPEVLNNKIIHEGVDYWALGCIVFQLLAGDRPFNDVSEYFIFKRITSLRYEFPADFPDANAKSLIESLLLIDPDDRLGTRAKGGFSGFKEHPFFEGVDWKGLPDSVSPLMATK
uniref:non-specific serine/threonine protein kinase n=1 Tax=Panagrellus redivivus TaxID=6233 RepID=A0A7E4V6U5_PANRE